MTVCEPPPQLRRDDGVQVALPQAKLVRLLRTGALAVQDIQCLDARSMALLRESVLESCVFQPATPSEAASCL